MKSEDAKDQCGGVAEGAVHGAHKVTEGPGGMYGKHSREKLKADAAALTKAVKPHAQTTRKIGSGDTDDGKKNNDGY